MFKKTFSDVVTENSDDARKFKLNRNQLILIAVIALLLIFILAFMIFKMNNGLTNEELENYDNTMVACLITSQDATAPKLRPR